VLTDINRYDSWYNVDGIFVDEMANTGPAERLNYYRDIYNHVKSIDSNWDVMGNPGTTTIEQYLTWPTADRLMVFENVGATYPGYSPSSWNFNYDRSKFVHLVHTEASSASMLSHLNLAVQRNAGGIFVTDDVLPNPWNRLPAYWSSLVDAVAAINADFNGNGVIDAADYVAWRKTDGSHIAYNLWRANFGREISSASISSEPAPEPATASLLIFGAIAANSMKRRTSSRLFKRVSQSHWNAGLPHFATVNYRRRTATFVAILDGIRDSALPRRSGSFDCCRRRSAG
jgi:hypothetical protein